MSILSKGLTLATALLVQLACANPTQKMFEQASRALEVDDFETAAKLFREVTIQAPDSATAAEAHFELAQIYYLRLRDVDGARSQLLKLTQEYPGSRVDVEARRLLARLYQEDLQNPDKAMRLYRTLLAENLEQDERRQTLLDVADCHYRMGEIEASANAYRLALELPYDGAGDSAYLRLANLEWLGGSPEESLRLLRELQELTANDDSRHAALVSEIEVLMSFGRFAAAGERVATAKRVFPDSADVFELEARLEATEAAHQSLDGESQELLLRELQKKIRWSGGRRRRRPPG